MRSLRSEHRRISMPDPIAIPELFHPIFDEIDSRHDSRFPVIRNRHTADREPISREVRRIVYLRDEFACQWCGSNWNLQLDHIVPWSAGGSDDLHNLRTLCADCNEARSNYDIDTVQRSAVLACSCLVCDDSINSFDSELTRVFCIECRAIGLGETYA